MSAIVANAVPISSAVPTVERQPVCITEKQKKILEETWKKIEGNQLGVGLMLFAR